MMDPTTAELDVDDFFLDQFKFKTIVTRKQKPNLYNLKQFEKFHVCGISSAKAAESRNVRYNCMLIAGKMIVDFSDSGLDGLARPRMFPKKSVPKKMFKTSK